MPRWLSVRGAARLVKKRAADIRRMIDEGRIAHRRNAAGDTEVCLLFEPGRRPPYRPAPANAGGEPSAPGTASASRS
jgi:hypothetical protein